jgi:peptidoglycan/LPS O-acetylase OafA/YrhL
VTSRRYDSLDHWRGAACLAVLVTHSVWYRSGTALELLVHDLAERLWIGVPVFFVVSGYCISAAADSHRRQAARPLRTYFFRRLRRIFPPYWVVLLGTASIVAVLDVAIPESPLSSSGQFLRPWWTLAYEEQFYVVVGVLIWAVPRRFFLGGFFVSAAVAAIALTAGIAGTNVEGFFFDGSWLQFWFGMVVYYALNYGTSRDRAAASALFLGAVLLSAVSLERLLSVQKTAEQAFFVAAAFALVAMWARPFDAAICRARWLRPLQVCGLMCYSLYLVHLPLVTLVHVVFITAGLRPSPAVSLAVCVPLSLVVAWQFHVVVERRFMNSPTVEAKGSPRATIGEARDVVSASRPS